MVERGGLDEARTVYAENLNPNAQCWPAIGYKEFFPFIKGEKLVSEVIGDLATATRHYAKRQLTYFRSFDNAVWVNPMTDKQKIFDLSNDFLNK